MFLSPITTADTPAWSKEVVREINGFWLERLRIEGTNFRYKLEELSQFVRGQLAPDPDTPVLPPIAVSIMNGLEGQAQRHLDTAIDTLILQFGWRSTFDMCFADAAIHKPKTFPQFIRLHAVTAGIISPNSLYEAVHLLYAQFGVARIAQHWRFARVEPT